jgi:hypothetical protein
MATENKLVKKWKDVTVAKVRNYTSILLKGQENHTHTLVRVCVRFDVFFAASLKTALFIGQGSLCPSQDSNQTLSTTSLHSQSMTSLITLLMLAKNVTQLGSITSTII